MNYKKSIAEAINRELNINVETIEQLIETPPKIDMGDFTFPCFKLAKIIRTPPNIIAKELKEKLHIAGFERVEILTSYLNFFIDKDIFMKDVLDEIITEGTSYGSSNIGEGKCICIECFSSDITNTLYLEQLFTIVIGNSLCKLFKKYGYSIKNLIKPLSLKQYEEGYSVFNINFDLEEEEWFYNNKMKVLVEELINKGLVNEIDESKLIMFSKFNLPPYIILKDNKFQAYPKVDLAVAIDRKDKYDFYQCIYVAGNKLKTKFKQVFKILELAGYEWSKDCIHAGVGLVKFNDIGERIPYDNGIVLNNVIREVIDKILHIVNVKNSNLDNRVEVANKIVIGVIIFTCLKNSREKNLLFDLEEMFSFEEGSYLYVQYSYARAINMLLKYKEINIKVNLNKLNLKEEFELVKSLEKFNMVINDAIEKLEPSILLVYIVEVTKSLNKIYNEYFMVNIKDKELMESRLALIKATCQVINNALDLIGVEIIGKYDILDELMVYSNPLV